MGLFERPKGDNSSAWRHLGNAVFLAAFSSVWLLDETNLAPRQILDGARVVISVATYLRFRTEANKMWNFFGNTVRLNQEQNKDKK